MVIPGPYRELIEAVGHESTFVSATLSGARRGASPPAQRVTIRPVELKAGRRLQFTAFDGRATDVVNLELAAAQERLADLLTGGFASAYVRTTEGDLQLTRSKKDTPRVIRHRPSSDSVDSAHDREKERIVAESAPFLHAVGITDHHGRVKPTARAKYRQVERFVEILSHTLGGDLAPGSTIRAVDLGCGAGVLTLATYHYLHVVRGVDVTMTGVDTKADLMERLNRTAADLGWDGLGFLTSTIGELGLDAPVDLVIALHACDTATDDALARAIGWDSRYVLAAPCCQHDLQAQLDRTAIPDTFAPLLRHGIVRERLGDLLTDSLRAEILRSHGYRTDIIEFVSTEHTAKNLMIRAVRTGRPDRAAGDAASRLSSDWHVTPALATRVGFHPG